MCYAPAEHAAKCPITYIKFMDKTEAEALDASVYTVLPFKGDSYLVYSKTSSDNLPITATIIADKPCMNPLETSISSKFYPTELDRK